MRPTVRAGDITVMVRTPVSGTQWMGEDEMGSGGSHGSRVKLQGLGSAGGRIRSGEGRVGVEKTGWAHVPLWDRRAARGHQLFIPPQSE